jgi:hypothetical protein
MAKSSNRTIEGWLARLRPVARLRHMRDRETVDSELRLLVAVRPRATRRPACWYVID